MITLQDLLRTASRTFAIGIEQLPGVLCDAGTVAYLLLRVSDYLEDNEDMPAENKITLLNLWAEILKGNAKCEELTSQIQNVDTSNPDAVVTQHAEDILARLASLPQEVEEIISQHVIHSTLGMARWVERGPQVNDEADMDDYMFEVAGRVGYLLTHLFAWYSTTIRWTLPSNTALAVGAKINYVQVNTFNPYTFKPVSVVLAKDLIGKYFLEKNKGIVMISYKPGDKTIPFQVIHEFTGKQLVGIQHW